MAAESNMDIADRAALGWLSSRISFSHDFVILHRSDDHGGSGGNGRKSLSFAYVEEDDEFEFRLPRHDEKNALSADDLFSQGMLKPLQWLPQPPLPPAGFTVQEYYNNNHNGNDDNDDGNIAVDEISTAMMTTPMTTTTVKKKKKKKKKRETELDLDLLYCGPGHMMVPMGSVGEAAWVQHFASKLVSTVLALRSSKASKRLKELFLNLSHSNDSRRTSSSNATYSPCGCNSTTESNSSPYFVNLVPKRAAWSNALSPPRFFNVLQKRAAPSSALFIPSPLGDSGENRAAPNSALSPLFTDLAEKRVVPNSALCPPFTNLAEKGAALSCAPGLEVVGLQKKNKGQSIKCMHSCTCFPRAMITPETN